MIFYFQYLTCIEIHKDMRHVKFKLSESQYMEIVSNLFFFLVRQNLTKSNNNHT